MRSDVSPGERQRVDRHLVEVAGECAGTACRRRSLSVPGTACKPAAAACDPSCLPFTKRRIVDPSYVAVTRLQACSGSPAASETAVLTPFVQRSKLRPAVDSQRPVPWRVPEAVSRAKM